jgi:hypothetical protein
MGLRGYNNPRQFSDVLSGQDCTRRDLAKARECRPTSPVVRAGSSVGTCRRFRADDHNHPEAIRLFEYFVCELSGIVFMVCSNKILIGKFARRQRTEWMLSPKPSNVSRTSLF